MSYTIRVVLNRSSIERWVRAVSPFVITDNDQNALPFSTFLGAVTFASLARQQFPGACVDIFDSDGDGVPVNEDDGE